jgi:hypothetical protein
MMYIRNISTRLLFAVGVIANLGTSCSGEPPPPQPAIPAEVRPIQLNVFFESSGSMDGYVNGVTDLESAMMSLIGGIGRSFQTSKNAVADNVRRQSFVLEGINLYTVASGDDGKAAATRRISNASIEAIDSWFRLLEPKTLGALDGRKSSELQSVLKLALDSVNDKKVSLLISDMILSPKNIDRSGQDGSNSLALQMERILLREQSQIVNSFSEALNRSSKRIAMLGYRFESQYHGFYAPEARVVKPKAKQIKGGAGNVVMNARPYFVWIIGSVESIEQIVRRVNVDQLREHRLTHACMMVEQTAKQKNIQYSVVSPLGLRYPKAVARNTGSYIKPEESNKVSVTGLANGRIVYAVDVVLPIHKHYGTVEATISGTSNGHKDQIILCDRLSNGVYRTYVSTIFPGGEVPSYGATTKITFAHAKPSWFTEFSVDDDDGTIADSVKQGQTFGLRFLMEGVWRAFYQQSSTVGTIQIELN